MTKPILTQSRLKELLDYNPATGIFIRKINAGPSARKGNIAGCINNDGYLIFNVDCEEQRAHRLAFLYMNGEHPSDQVDHINHIRNDNRWCNLRLASSYENSKNRSKGKGNISGVVGVRIHLGSHKYKEIAVMIRKAAEAWYGFHKNHGAINQKKY